MRLVDSIEDRMNRFMTFELDDGRCVRLDARAVEEFGAAEILTSMGIMVNKGKPVPVYQRGQMVGTVPFDFEPAMIKSKTMLYDPRPGDFRRTKTGWEASPQMGPGDLLAISGFNSA